MMNDDSISQAEIDALVKGVVSGGSGGGDIGGPGPGGGGGGGGDADSLLKSFVEKGIGALSQLIGVECVSTVKAIKATTAQEANAILAGQVMVGQVPIMSGLSGNTYYVMGSLLSLTVITQLYGGVAPSDLDESALGALGEGLTQINHAGLSVFSEKMGKQVLGGQAEVNPGSGLLAAPGINPAMNVYAITVDIELAESSGRILMAIPQDAVTTVLQGAKKPAPAPKPAESAPQESPAAKASGAASSAAPAAMAAPPGETHVAGGGGHAGQPVSYQTAQFPDLSPKTRSEDIRNIDLLMDVNLQVTVELGRTRRQIRDVLALGPGSVVELDKLAGEQVDVLVNGKLIAKGEVVVIDENYGVRITDIISPADRVQSLK